MSEKSKNFRSFETNHQQNVNAADSLWLEWKDSDLNNEKWGFPKNGPDGLFLDIEQVMMPRSLEAYQWIRAKDLKHLTGPLKMYTATVEHPDLIINNKHLLHSEYIRWFISALTNLQYHGRNGLEISGESSNFTWACRHDPWHGWMHMYSMNKAGKGVQHEPVINLNGKYIVRLYCLGCWRRIVIDDTIPVDRSGRPLLPRTSNNVELWPMLLAKALLKVASLTWTDHHEIVDFHPITCLTGWTCLTLNIAHLSSQDKWDFLLKYSKRFEWTMQPDDHVSESTKSITNDNTRKPRETLRLLTEAEKSQPITLFLLLRDMRELGNDAVPGLSPCWDHVIHVVQSRDIPLDPKDVKPPLERWKLHRWLKWAISRNIIDPADYFIPIRYLKVISPLEECNESVIYDEVNIDENSNLTNKTEQFNKPAWEMTSQKTLNLFNTKKEATSDISRWIDFNKMAPYVMEIHLFYKPQYFQYSVQIMGDILKISHKNEANTRETKENLQTYNWSHKTQKSRNKPLYLFCDSLETKFCLISLCAVQKKKYANSCKRDYLILEKHNWFFKPSQANQLATISTNGTKSIIIELEAGRQLLQMYRRSESSIIVILSDTAFHLGNRETVQQLMITESKRIECMSKLISSSLCKAYQSFGTKDYSINLKDYYRSYMPSSLDISRKDKNLRMLIHHYFIEEQVRLIQETFSDKELRNILYSLRVFFLNPNIRLKYFNLSRTQRSPPENFTTEKKPYSRVLNNCNSDLDLNQAAKIIQSFFKMILIRKYRCLHNPVHALHMEVRQELLKVSDLFDSSLTSQMLRNVINRYSDLHDLYHCSKDFMHVLNIQEFRGILKDGKQDQWFPIARLVVNPKSSKTIFAVFELSVDLPRFTLRVFNNQDRREITHVVNHVASNRYEHLPAGYMMFAYGWNEKQLFKEVDWIIRIITMKGESIFYQLNEQPPSLEIKPPKLMIEKLAATYLPNARNCISRWNLHATSGTIISMRLTTSYDMVEIRMKITDDEGNVLADVSGGSTILLPLVILEQSYVRNKENHRKVKEENSNVKEEFGNTIGKKNLYHAEAFVLNNSWPLTDAEWTVVNQVKTKKMEDLKNKIQSGNKTFSNLAKEESKSISDGQSLEPPYWTLQVIADARNAVEIYQDKRREQEVAILKKTWSEDQDRSARGKELRQVFLDIYTSKIEPDLHVEEIEKESKIIKTDMIFCTSHTRERRTLQLPESHHLPSLDLTKYMKKDKTIRVKTESDYEMMKNQQNINITDSQKNYSNYLENLTELMNKQFRKYAKLFERRKENFRKRRALLNVVYESRKVYIDALISEKMKIKEKNKK